ncbi:hypothetical protein RJT34_02305 [Clitoria ternatea]|uniref:Uncharacterized protein n=1 Tax=Clitoria ternatea TaxID=43366 RepID=A0AAN9KK91_CLITE
MNCLTCGQMLQRVNSEEFLLEIKPYKKSHILVDRSWSGNLSPPKGRGDPPRRSGGAVSKIKTEHHRRTNSEGDVGPRLARSSGMRREWSFQDLRGATRKES